MSRSERITIFLARAGWGAATRAPLAGDASNRRYERLVHPDLGTAVLMDAPPDAGEDIKSFIKIAKHLAALGLGAPRILAHAPQEGFVLSEDLGDSLFARVLERAPEKASLLYEAAVDVLLWLRTARLPSVDDYHIPLMADLAALSVTWYRRCAMGETADAQADVLRRSVTDTLKALAPEPSILVLRDYHAENLIWRPDRSGLARVGLLDFQDAMSGHPAYDLMSLLRDARRKVPADLAEAMTARYIAGANVDEKMFRQACSAVSAQRNLRILGVFTRLCVRDGKPHYIDLIPHVWANLQADLAHPALSELGAVVDAVLPLPETALCDRLKALAA
ncbi:MAG: phosphotransferase [Pseudomonadota bacterium]